MDDEYIRERAIKAVNDVARQVGMDISDNETADIDIVTPQFDRADGIDPGRAPTTDAEVDALKGMSRGELLDLGMRQWDESGLMLFPVEWYDDLPEGIEITTVNGVTKEFDRSEDMKEKRFGMLPFGIYTHE